MKADSRPNILFVFTDQQSATMMSCAGNPYLRTPAMDSLAASGARFERAYCTNPLCVPSRFSLMTGLMPSEIGLKSNDASHIDAIPDSVTRRGMGRVFRDAGYDVAYGGKVHLPKMSPEDIGFDHICHDDRDALADACGEFISQRQDRPFLLVASFVNPHDICYMAIRDFAETELSKSVLKNGRTGIANVDRALQRPEGIGEEEFLDRHCPPLPENFEPQQDEPEAISMMQARRPFKRKAREKYTEEQWRLHRWAYCRLTEMVDAQIGRVLDALSRSGQEENTLAVFSSDHGDMDAAHRMEHKSAFYKEACRVPLIMALPGVTRAGAVNERHLVSNGLDLMPTLCDYAGIETPEGLTGLSVRPLAEGREPPTWRRSLPLESEIGRMIVTDRYKYALHDAGENGEQLVDLLEDPGEMRNVARDPGYEGPLCQCRRLFEEVFGGERRAAPDRALRGRSA